MVDADFTTEELAAEEWRPIVGWEGSYSISNLGRVRSEARIVIRTDGRRCHVVAKVLRSARTNRGYLVVSLPRHGTRHAIGTVHLLVANAFLGTRTAEQREINHIDGDKTNNRVSNLERCSRRENAVHASRMGLLTAGDAHWTRRFPERVARGSAHPFVVHPETHVSGEKHWNAKLTESDIRAMREERASGATYAEIGRRYGIRKCTAHGICTGKAWRHVA